MGDFLRNHQLNIMLGLGSVCLMIAFFVSVTKTLSKKRKRILIFLELSAAVLLFADRFAYIYRGDVRVLGFYMVRISNFLVFAATLLVIEAVNLYLSDLFVHEGGLSVVPARLKIVNGMVVIGLLLLILSQFTGLYYTFDETNHYERAPLFIICYVIPLLMSLLMLSTIVQYFFRLNKGVRESLLLFTVTPTLASILQIFMYGLSLTNLALGGVVTVLYIFVLLDMNETVEQAHRIEKANMALERESMRKLFEQTAMAFVSAVEKRDPFTQGNSVRVAHYARQIAELSGKEAEECEKVYYAALLHNVGLIGIPDSVIQKTERLSDEETEIMHRIPIIGNEILSSITEYPFLSVASRYIHEWYNGTGYPDGLKGEEIPEIARIIAVANAYVAMTSRRRYRDAKLDFMAREAFIKGSGEIYDPKFADIMIKIIDTDTKNAATEKSDTVETELSCGTYRDTVSSGIPIDREVTMVTFRSSRKIDDEAHAFFGPSVIVFDSFDKKIHDNEKAIAAYQYTEYGEIWFNGHCISTAARKLEEKNLPGKEERDSYKIVMGRIEDHLRLCMSSPLLTKEIIIALPNGSKSSYIALTGENCVIQNVSVKKTGEVVKEGDIPRIASVISYTDRMESDIRNVQVDRPRSDATEGIELKDDLEIVFHSMSLPGAHLIWHCPYIVLFRSDDGIVNGKNYREYGLVKLSGENEGDTAFAKNRIAVKRTGAFPGWDAWNQKNKEGLECQLNLRRKGSRVILKTKVMGMEIENTTTVMDDADQVYVALTGDQVALTDIRVRRA